MRRFESQGGGCGAQRGTARGGTWHPDPQETLQGERDFWQSPSAGRRLTFTKKSKVESKRCLRQIAFKLRFSKGFGQLARTPSVGFCPHGRWGPGRGAEISEPPGCGLRAKGKCDGKRLVSSRSRAVPRTQMQEAGAAAQDAPRDPPLTLQAEPGRKRHHLAPLPAGKAGAPAAALRLGRPFRRGTGRAAAGCRRGPRAAVGAGFGSAAQRCLPVAGGVIAPFPASQPRRPGDRLLSPLGQLLGASTLRTVSAGRGPSRVS